MSDCRCTELVSDYLLWGEHFHDEDGNRIAPESVTWMADTGPEETALRQVHEDFAKAYPATLDEAVDKLRAYPHDPEGE